MADRTVKVTLIANAAGFIRGMDEARRATRQTTQDATARLAEQRDAYNELGRSALAVGTIAAAAVGLAVARFAEFDRAMSEVQASTHESASNMSLLRDAAIEAGASTVFTATEAANAIDELAKAGVSTADILGGALAGSLDLASAGGLGVAEAASIAATAMTQFNIAGADVPHVADLLAAGAGKAQGSVQDLSQALNQGGLVASQAGFSIEETTGTLAAFASAGLLGSDAGTSLKTAIIALEKPSAAAAATMKQYGISVYDSNGSMLSFSGIAGQLQDKLGGLTEQQRNSALATIFGTDAIRSAGVLYAQGAEGIEQWESKVNDSGYAAETARLKLDNLSGDIEKLGGAVDSGLIKSGSSANDVLRGLTQGVTGLVDTISSLPEPVLAVGLGLTGLVGGAGLLGGGFLALVPKISATKLAMESLNLSGKSLLKGFGKGGAIALGLASLASGLAAVGQDASLTDVEISKLDASLKTANLYNLNSQFDTGRRGVDGFAESLKQLYTDDFFQSEQSNLWWSRLIKGASGGAIDFAPGLDKAVSQFKELGTQMAQLAKTDFRAADNQFQQLVKQAQAAGAGSEVYQELLNAMGPYKSALVEMASAAGYATDDQSILNIAMQKGSTYTQLMRDAASKNAASLDEMAGVAGDASDAVSDLAEQIKNFASGQFDMNAAQRDFEAAVDSATDSLQAQKDAYQEANGTLDGFVASLDIGSASGRENSAALDEIAKKANESAAAIFAQTGSVDQSTAALNLGRDALYNQLAAFGVTGSAADLYVAKLLATPKDLQTAVVLNGIQRSQEQIDAFIAANHNRVVSIQVNATNPNIGFGLGDGRAEGGAIYGPGGPRDDTAGIFRLSNGEHVLTAADVQAMGGQRSVYKFRSALHGYAAGGEVGPVYRPAPRGGTYASSSVHVAPQVSLAGARIVIEVGGRQIEGVIQEQIVAAEQQSNMASMMGVQ